MAGINQPVTKDAVAVPANPSRARIPAAVQVGAAPMAASKALIRFRRTSLISFGGLGQFASFVGQVSNLPLVVQAGWKPAPRN